MVAEECDSGKPGGDRTCTSICEVDDFLVVEPPAQPPQSPSQPKRSLQGGRHTIAGNTDTFAVAYEQEAPGVPFVGLQVLSRAGEPTHFNLTADAHALLQSNPVVAALPNDAYAVAWTDFGSDGDELGVALRLVDPRSSTPGPLQHANSRTGFSQQDPDLVWTDAGIESELVAALKATGEARLGMPIVFPAGATTPQAPGAKKPYEMIPVGFGVVMPFRDVPKLVREVLARTIAFRLVRLHVEQMELGGPGSAYDRSKEFPGPPPFRVNETPKKYFDRFTYEAFFENEGQLPVDAAAEEKLVPEPPVKLEVLLDAYDFDMDVVDGKADAAAATPAEDEPPPPPKRKKKEEDK